MAYGIQAKMIANDVEKKLYHFFRCRTKKAKNDENKKRTNFQVILKIVSLIFRGLILMW